MAEEENKEPPILMAEEEEGTANWSDLPYDLMELILEQLTNVPSTYADVSNYARWAAVCVSWQQALDIYELYITPQLPLLMIPASINNYNDDEAVDGFCSFYRITDGKSLDQFQVRMPRNSYCRGSGHGWLIMVEDDVNKGFPVRLCNPFLSEEILLPSLKLLPLITEEGDVDEEEDPEDLDPCDGYTYLHKAFLSADPLSYPDRYIVLAIYGNKIKRLAFLRSGDKSWNPIERNIIRRFEDVNFQIYQDSDGLFKPMFCAVTYKGDLVRFREADLLLALNNEQQPELGKRVRVRGPPSIRTNKLYLVPTGKKEIIFRWILVLRTIHIDDDDDDQAENRSMPRPYSTKELKVFQIVSEEDQPSRFEWKEMDNLGGHTLLVGDNNSMCIDAAEYPGCKPDSIYYTDDYYLRYVKDHPQYSGGPHDMGVFNVKDGSFEKHFLSNRSSNNPPMWPVPVWIEPSLSLREIHMY